MHLCGNLLLLEWIKYGKCEMMTFDVNIVDFSS